MNNLIGPKWFVCQHYLFGREKVTPSVFLGLRVPSLDDKLRGSFSLQGEKYCRINSIKVKLDFKLMSEEINAFMLSSSVFPAGAKPEPASAKPVPVGAKQVPAGSKPVSAGAKPVLATKSILKSSVVVCSLEDEPDQEEIIILEDDHVTAETHHVSGLYAVFVHPVLVHLSGVEPGTRAVSFKSDLYSYKPMNPAKVKFIYNSHSVLLHWLLTLNCPYGIMYFQFVFLI